MAATCHDGREIEHARSSMRDRDRLTGELRVPHGGPSSALPLRPLTTAEVLDAAVSLLREYGRVLLPAGIALAVVEQLALAPLRAAAGVRPPSYLPAAGSEAVYWLLLVVGCGTEAAIIALLGGLSARGAVAGLLGRRLSARQLLAPRGGRFPAVALLAAVAALVTAGGALLGPVWAVGYALVGLAVPVLVVDRVGPGQALVRGAALASRAGLRAGSIRVLGYLAWLGIRLALGFGGVAALGMTPLGNRWAAEVSMLVWLLVNSIAYPTLACLDAALHLETRMRTEGLDIWLARAGRSQLTPAALAVRR
jgi:hypothetical protein